MRRYVLCLGHSSTCWHADCCVCPCAQGLVAAERAALRREAVAAVLPAATACAAVRDYLESHAFVATLAALDRAQPRLSGAEGPGDKGDERVGCANVALRAV
jgi:hypothetical protein